MNEIDVVLSLDMLLVEQEQIFTKCHDILEAKNKDYSLSGDAFYNLKAVERNNIIPTEIGLLARMNDKFARICNLIKNCGLAMVKDETLEDTMLDMINYLVLTLAYLKVKRARREEASAKEEPKEGFTALVA